MSAPNKMFTVIVVGGFALVDCGARTELGHPLAEDASSPIRDAADEDAPITFPQETAFVIDSSAPLDASEEFSFPGEANVPIPDSGG